MAMASVLGIGGFFFRSRDPKALARWYADHFDVLEVPDDYDTACWRQSGGATVFAPFEQDTAYFGDSDKQWMIAFRVRDLVALAARLEAAGIPAQIDEQSYPNGRFARLTDPEGNPIQLWEPAGAARETEESPG